MSRTDKDAPRWVRMMHLHQDGGSTEVLHSWRCEDYDRRFRRHVAPFRLRLVEAAEAATMLGTGLALEVVWSSDLPDGPAQVKVADGPHPCDVDSAASTRCLRYASSGSDLDRRTGTPRAIRRSEYFGPERAAVRVALRDALKAYRSDPDWFDADPPTRQARRSTWAGGWWD